MAHLRTVAVLGTGRKTQAVRTVYLEDHGVVESIRAQTLVVDTSTVAPETSHRIGGTVHASRGHFLDCPVSGSVASVAVATLAIMAGGDPIVIGRAPAKKRISDSRDHVIARSGFRLPKI